MISKSCHWLKILYKTYLRQLSGFKYTKFWEKELAKLAYMYSSKYKMSASIYDKKNKQLEYIYFSAADMTYRAIHQQNLISYVSKDWCNPKSNT